MSDFPLYIHVSNAFSFQYIMRECVIIFYIEEIILFWHYDDFRLFTLTDMC